MCEIIDFRIINQGSILELEKMLKDKDEISAVLLTIQRERLDLYKNHLLELIRKNNILWVYQIEEDLSADNLEIAVRCHIRISHENVIISNFYEKLAACEKDASIMMGKNRHIAVREKSDYTCDDLWKIGFINEVFVKNQDVIKNYVLNLIKKKSKVQIQHIITCYNAYIKLGLDAPREMLLQEEAEAFSKLSQRKNNQ